MSREQTRLSRRPARLWPLLLLALLIPPLSGADEARPINVSIQVFDAGVPEDAASHRSLQIFPRIREIEAMLLPFVLREALIATGDWGAVRVVPEADNGAELLVRGVIGRSDGEVLEVRVTAADASGRIWLDQAFAGAAGSDSIYIAIAAELRKAREQFDARSLERIVDVSLLRYAGKLAPTAFAGYLDERPDGTFELRRLPAHDDPMVARILMVRETEYVITDAVDAEFRKLHEEIAAIYELWREYRRKNLEYQQQDAVRAQSTPAGAGRGSYEAMKRIYDNYKNSRITAQEQDRLAVAFDNEVGPRVDAMEARVTQMQIWVDRKYAEWYRILEELFEVETGTGY